MSSDTSTLPIPSDAFQRRQWIKYQLVLKGTSLAKIAEELGVLRQAVSDALIRPSENIEMTIAEKLGRDVKEVFPDRYDEDGKRIHRSRSRAGAGQ